MDHLGAVRMECGATSVAADGAIRANQCLYLALAAAVAAPNESHHPLAAELRTQIESAVRAACPNWATQNFLGQEVGAFADFLTWGLQSAPRLRGRAVAVYNGQDGTCEIFRSQHHTGRSSPLVELWFSGTGEGRLGHYLWPRVGNPSITLGELLTLHRRRGSQGARIPTITTNAIG